MKHLTLTAHFQTTFRVNCYISQPQSGNPAYQCMQKQHKRLVLWVELLTALYAFSLYKHTKIGHTEGNTPGQEMHEAGRDTFDTDVDLQKKKPKTVKCLCLNFLLRKERFNFPIQSSSPQSEDRHH